MIKSIVNNFIFPTITAVIGFSLGIMYQEHIRNKDDFRQMVQLMQERNTLSDNVVSSAGGSQFIKRWDSYINEGQIKWAGMHNQKGVRQI